MSRELLFFFSSLGGWLMLTAVVSSSGCSGEEPTRSCTAEAPVDCQPLYADTSFHVLFEKIFQPSCAQGQGTCHTADAKMGGLSFANEDQAHVRLLLDQGDDTLVIPGAPSCGVLTQKLEASDAGQRMPPGPTPLLPSERCAIRRWIAAGAAR